MKNSRREEGFEKESKRKERSSQLETKKLRIFFVRMDSWKKINYFKKSYQKEKL